MRLMNCVFSVCTAGLLLAQSPYLRDGSIGKAKEEFPVNNWPQFKYISISEWQGKRVIYLPRPASLRKFGYQAFSGGSGQFGCPTYEEAAGKIGTVMAVEMGQFPKVVIGIEGSSRRYVGTIYLETLDGVAFLDEIDQARKELIGKTLWILSSDIETYDETSEKYGSVKVRKFSPVKVTDVVVGWRNEEPIRLILKSENGDEGFLDVNISGTNGSKRLVGYTHIDKRFSLVDPKRAYPWPKPIWDAIQDEKVALGMTKEQVRMSWGEPKSISQTVTAAGKSEQWVFGSGAYVYFTGGFVSGIQNEK
jgi:hypothetical protein